MLTKFSRPFSVAERRLLRWRMSKQKAWSAPWTRRDSESLAWTVGLCAGLIAIGLLVQQLIISSIGAVLLAAAEIDNFLKRRRVRNSWLRSWQQLAEELELSTAFVIACEPVRIIEREEIEDEGALWVFDGGEGLYVALCGQIFEATPRFPAARFNVVMGARHQTMLGIRSRGLRSPSSVVVSYNDSAWATFPKSPVTLFHAPKNADLPTIHVALQTSNAA